MTKDQLEDAVRDFFSGTSRPTSETKDALEEIAILCEELASIIEAEE